MSTWKGILDFLKPITPNQNPINLDSFDNILNRINKALTSQNMTDPKVISQRKTKKAIDKITTALAILVNTNPLHSKTTYPKINSIFCQLLSPLIEGENRRSVWNNAITVISACDSVVEFQHWEACIETAFYFKQIRNITDTKIGETITEQCFAVTNNAFISSNPSKFNYWINIISQFVLPLFWSNYKCINKKCRNSIAVPFLSFFSRNMAIPNSISTLSNKHSNPLISFYTMQLLLLAGNQIALNPNDVSDLSILVLKFIHSTFPVKISPVFVPNDMPKGLSFDKAIQFFLQQHEKYNQQLLLTFFRSELEETASNLILQISKSTNICPQIFIILSTLYYKLTEVLHNNLRGAIAKKAITVQSYSNLLNHLLHLRPFITFCEKNVPADKIGSSLVTPIFNCNSKFLIHQFISIFFTLYFDSGKYQKNVLSDRCQKLISIAESFEISDQVDEILNLYSVIFSVVVSSPIFDVKSAPPAEEAFISNPVLYAISNKKLFGSKLSFLFFLFPLTTEKMDTETAQNFALSFIEGVGKISNFAHTAKFVDTLFTNYFIVKKFNPRVASTFIYKTLSPLLMDLFHQSPSKDLLAVLSRLFENVIFKRQMEDSSSIRWIKFLYEASTCQNKEISANAILTEIKCHLSPFKYRNSIVPLINSNFKFDFGNIEIVLRYLSSTMGLSKQLQNCPSSLKLMCDIVKDDKFKITSFFHSTFLFVLEYEFYSRDPKISSETLLILQKLLNCANLDDECILNLISIIPYHASEISAKFPDFILSMVIKFANFAKVVASPFPQFRLVMRFISDLLINLDINDSLFEKCIIFMLQKIDDSEKAAYRDKCFAFFLSNFRRNTMINNINNYDCAIVDSTSTIISFDFKSGSITVANQFDTNTYVLNDIIKESLVEPKRTDHSIGYLVPHPDAPLIIDALTSQKKGKQWMLASPKALAPVGKFLNRSCKERHIVTVAFMGIHQRKVEEFVLNKIEQTSTQFVSFLESIGDHVKIADTDFASSVSEKTGIYFDNCRHQVLFLPLPLMETPSLEKFSTSRVSIVFFECPFDGYSDRSNSVVVIMIRALDDGMVLVNAAVKNLPKEKSFYLPFVGGMPFSVPKTILGAIVRDMVIIAENQLTAIGEEEADEILYKKTWGPLDQHRVPLF